MTADRGYGGRERTVRLAGLGLVAGLIGCVYPSIDTLPEDCQIEGETILAVWTQRSEHTDVPTFLLCLDDETCWPHRSWFIHDARVLGVLRGHYPARDIRFVVSQHTYYVDKAVRPWYVSLEAIEDESLAERLGTDLKAVETCFGENLRDE